MSQGRPGPEKSKPPRPGGNRVGVIHKETKIGQYFRLIRNSCGLTMRGLADASEGEFSFSFVCHIETGRAASPSPATIRAAANVFSTRVDREKHPEFSYEYMMFLCGYTDGPQS